MTVGAAFLRVDDLSLLLVVALAILAGGIIAYLDERTIRKPRDDKENPRRAA